MSDVSTENKLRLLKQIRSRYQEDQLDLNSREQILYGKSSRSSSRYESPVDEDPLPDGQVSFFRLRFVLAAMLVGLVILMDVKGISLAGITADKIFQAISADFEEKLEQWAVDSQSSI